MDDAGHAEVSRRFFLGCAALATGGTAGFAAAVAEPLPAELVSVLEQLEPFFTRQADFNDVSRGRPVPHSLSEEVRREVGLTRETWKLDVVSDPAHPAALGRQFARRDDTALDFATLLAMGENQAVRFAKVMTCLNIGCPLGMGLWEGVPLRAVVALARPQENLRRVFYYGYHNDDESQQFRSSLPVGRVLEDYDGLPPVILCYKLNGEWLTPERGGPVRIVVPEHYGFKSVKWLTHVVLSNLFHANDTYGAQNNDVDSPLKTFVATLHVPDNAVAQAPLPVVGYAQVGVSGLSKVQVWISPEDLKWPDDDPHFSAAPWSDATILPPPARWGGGMHGGLLSGAFGFDAAGAPLAWPMRLAKAHWAALLPGVPAGRYVLRCRSVDAAGHAQPMPRPFKKGGRCDIESVTFTVAG